MSQVMNKKQLIASAARQSTNLTEPERIVFAYLMAKAQQGILGLKIDAYKEIYEPAADHLYMCVKTYQ